MPFHLLCCGLLSLLLLVRFSFFFFFFSFFLSSTFYFQFVWDKPSGHLLEKGKSLAFRLCTFIFDAALRFCAPLLFGVSGKMWNSIVSISSWSMYFHLLYFLLSLILIVNCKQSFQISTRTCNTYTVFFELLKIVMQNLFYKKYLLNCSVLESIIDNRLSRFLPDIALSCSMSLRCASLRLKLAGFIIRRKFKLKRALCCDIYL